MIYLFLAALVFALIFCARLLLRQNRLIEQLRGAIRFQQPLLKSEGNADHLPEWPGLVEDTNKLISENLTLQQQRSGQLTQLEATLGNLREAVLIVDESNYVHLANRALREIFPASRDLVNLRLELIVRSAAFLAYVRATRAGQPLARQEFEINDGATSTWIEASGAPIPSPDGKAQWALFVIHDMTQQRILERMRRDFVANASHELRTPLSVIKGYVETLVDGHATMSDEERTKFLATIQRHSDRLNAIIADLLTLSRLESATPGVNFEPIDLRAFLMALVDDTAQRPTARRHALACRLDVALGEISGNSEKLTQLFGNLLDNALKYSPPGANIVVEARALTAGGEVEVVVRDTGPGIPEADLPHIFERFYRVEKGRSRGSGGTGLGLSIVKHTAQLHGGRVWAESEVGKGTAIFVRLPRAISATRDPAK
jgi:two-component system phosphate regulon sensor histidine kinase PhoR